MYIIDVFVFVSDVGTLSCSPTTVAWHPHHRSTIAIGKAHQQIIERQ